MDTLPSSPGELIRRVEFFLLGRLGDPDLARDLAQEAYARLLRVQRSGVPLRDPRAWVFRAARNLAVDEIRRKLPCPLGLDALGLIAERQAREEGSEPLWRLGAREVARGELLELLPTALGRLPAQYRRLLDAHYVEGLGCEAVAEREALTPQNVKVKLFRARNRLRALLEAQLHRGNGAHRERL